MSRMTWFCNRFCQPKKYPQQRRIDQATGTEVKDIIRADPFLTINKLYMTDRSYKLVDIEHLRRYLRDNPVSERKYVPEKYDCDDFSYVLQGDITRWDSDLAVGIVHGKKVGSYYHAWNICVSTEREVWFIEPQNDKVWKPTDKYELGLIVV